MQDPQLRVRAGVRASARPPVLVERGRETGATLEPGALAKERERERELNGLETSATLTFFSP